MSNMDVGMSEIRSRHSPSRRDRALRRVRRTTWAIGAGTAGLATTLSVVSAHAFKGHSRNPASAAAAAAKPRPLRRVVVPAPQRVPAIADNPAPLQPPAAPPSATPAPAPPAAAPAPAPAPQPQPQPQTSGGS
jgi:hypothetical protein